MKRTMSRELRQMSTLPLAVESHPGLHPLLTSNVLCLYPHLSKVVWQVVKDGNLVREYNEEEIRFTISCKFHLFRSEEEAEKFYSGSGEKLTAESILDGLVLPIILKDANHFNLGINSLLNKIFNERCLENI